MAYSLKFGDLFAVRCCIVGAGFYPTMFAGVMKNVYRGCLLFPDIV